MEWTGTLALAESGHYGDRDDGGIEVRVVLLRVEMDRGRVPLIPLPALPGLIWIC